MKDRARTAKRDAFHLAGVTYTQKWIACGDCHSCPHGPYWYASFRARGAHRTRYIGPVMPPVLVRMLGLRNLEVGLAVRRSLASSLRAAVRTATRMLAPRRGLRLLPFEKASAASQRSA